MNAGHPSASHDLDAPLLGRRNGVDGFRLDLAGVIGRHGVGITGRLLEDAARSVSRTGSSEPWDLGTTATSWAASAGWLEWNDHFRDG
jgi:pullulanase/glycogen debranching enzyme